MMVNPTKRELEIREKVMPWLRLDDKTEEFYLIAGTPDDVRKAWEEWKKIAEEESKNPFYQECGQKHMKKY